MKFSNNTVRHIYVVGGGFAGIRAALDLADLVPKNTEITIVSDKHHFEYYPRIYRVVLGASPREVCIPLHTIFKNKRVNIVNDQITGVNLDSKTLTGKSGVEYKYDDVILALGSETAYFGIEGVQERSFGFKSIEKALALKNHLHKMFDIYMSAQKEDIISQLHIVVVGGGPSGVELAGGLIAYLHRLALHHSVKNEFITIDIVEASANLVPTLPVEVSTHVNEQLHKLGVNIFLNRSLVKEDLEVITMKDMSMRSHTVIWTAGSRTNHLFESIKGLKLFRNGRVIVDGYLRPEGFENVYIAGDSAHTPYAGLAQTALYDASYIARSINADIRGKGMKKYTPKKVAYAVPVGKGWAAVSIGPMKIYGWFGYIVRELVDLDFFMKILPVRKALRIFFSKPLRTSCPSCNDGTC